MSNSTPLPSTILLATDGSPDSRLAARAAADLATRGGAALHVLHAWEPYRSFSGMVPVVSPVMDPDSARALVAEEVTYLRAQHHAPVAGVHVRVGAPVREILDLAAQIHAGMIVMGSRGLGAVRRAVLGSVSEDVVHHAHVPVLVMRGGAAAWPPTRVVVGDDATPDAIAMLRLAGAVAEMFGAAVTLVHALPKLRETLRGNGEVHGPVVDDILEFAQAELEEHAASLPPEVHARTIPRVVTGDAAEALLDAADMVHGHALVVVGSRGLGGFDRLRLGSVSTAMLRHGGGPVLVGAHAAAPQLHVVSGEASSAG